MVRFRIASLVLIPTLLSVWVGCGKKNASAPEEELVWGQTVRGKVTSLGLPVKYGYVLFFHSGKSNDPKSGRMLPLAHGKIRTDGSYEATNVPAGPMMVCVVTDPDLDEPTLLAGSKPGGGPPRRPPGVQGPPDEGPPDQGGPPMPPFGKEGPPMPPFGKEGPPMPPFGKEGPPFIPGKEGFPMFPGKEGAPKGPTDQEKPKLTEDEKKQLKAIHQKFGIIGLSPLHYVVREGVQDYDINLDEAGKK